jgi:NitT/TauT family transport system substrate-binding protein
MIALFRRRLAATLGLLAALAIPALAPTGASAQTRQVRLAWTPSADGPQLAVAMDKGLWKARGIDVSVVAFQTGREALEALIGGQVDYAFIAEFPAVTGALRKQPFSVVADLSRYKANRLVTTTDIASMAALAGKRVGTTIGTNAQYQAESALAAAGVTAIIVNAGPADLLPTLQRKDIDAAAMFPAFFAKSKQLLGARYKELPTPGYVTHFLIVGTDTALKDHAADASAFISGLVDADAVIAKDPAGARQSVFKVINGVLPLPAIAAAWPDYEIRVQLDPSLPELMTAQARWVASKGLIKATPAAIDEVGAVIKPDILRQIAADRVTLK